MAIVKTVKCPNGATVIFNDKYLTRDPEERERRRAEAWAVAYRIAAENAAKREAMNAQNPQP